MPCFVPSAPGLPEMTLYRSLAIAPRMKQLVLDIARPPAPTLDNFVPGRNEELVAAFYATANGARSEQFIYMWGAPGSGRSHLLRAAVAAARAAGKPATFLSPARASSPRPKMRPMMRFSRSMTCICWHPQAQIAFFNLHNRIKAGQRHVDRKRQCGAGRARFARRLDRRGSGQASCIRVHGLNEEEKVAALRRHAQARGFELSSEVVAYLLRHVQRDMPSLLCACSKRSTAIRSQAGARSRCRCCANC